MHSRDQESGSGRFVCVGNPLGVNSGQRELASGAVFYPETRTTKFRVADGSCHTAPTSMGFATVGPGTPSARPLYCVCEGETTETPQGEVAVTGS